MRPLLQARSRSIETQLAEATAALREMRAKHSQLEARNQLLEKVAVLNKAQTSSSDQTLLWQASLPHLYTIQNVNLSAASQQHCAHVGSLIPCSALLQTIRAAFQLELLHHCDGTMLS